MSRYSQKDVTEQEDLYFDCDQCHNNFKTKTNMKIYMETIHQKKEPMKALNNLMDMLKSKRLKTKK